MPGKLFEFPRLNSSSPKDIEDEDDWGGEPPCLFVADDPVLSERRAPLQDLGYSRLPCRSTIQTIEPQKAKNGTHKAYL
jgi:hypothetical protein